MSPELMGEVQARHNFAASGLSLFFAGRAEVSARRFVSVTPPYRVGMALDDTTLVAALHRVVRGAMAFVWV